MPKSVMFKTAYELVAFRCFVQRVDTPEDTSWQVIDRFASGDESRFVGTFPDESSARLVLAEVRARRLAQVNANKRAYQMAV